MIRPRVVLADDYPALLEVAAGLLKPQFDVVGAATEALGLCPDVIVTDITMPVLSDSYCEYVPFRGNFDA